MTWPHSTHYCIALAKQWPCLQACFVAPPLNNRIIMGASMLASTTRHEGLSFSSTISSRKTLTQNESEHVPPVSQTLIRLANPPITLWPTRRRQAICCHSTLLLHPGPAMARGNPQCEPHRCCHVACVCCLYDLLWAHGSVGSANAVKVTRTTSHVLPLVNILSIIIELVPARQPTAMTLYGLG